MIITVEGETCPVSLLSRNASLLGHLEKPGPYNLQYPTPRPGCFRRHVKSTRALLQSCGVCSKQAGLVPQACLIRSRQAGLPPQACWCCSRHAAPSPGTLSHPGCIGSAPDALDLLKAGWTCSRHAGPTPGTLDQLQARYVCSRHARPAQGTLDPLEAR